MIPMQLQLLKSRKSGVRFGKDGEEKFGLLVTRVSGINVDDAKYML